MNAIRLGRSTRKDAVVRYIAAVILLALASHVATFVHAGGAAPMSSVARGAGGADEAIAGVVVEIARERAESRVDRPLVLDVEHLRVIDTWAFIVGELRGRDGTPLDYAGTYLEEAAREGGASHVFCALLKRRSDQWTIVADCLGATDVAWEGWDRRFGAPPALFDLDDSSSGGG